MTFPITETLAKSARHASFYLACGPEEGPPIIFIHGWPELSISWRHQLPAFAALGFRAIAPDMRGYGRSSQYARHEDYAVEAIVADMIELLDHLGEERAIWVGHDWGSPVVWSLASHHPDRCLGVANLCVPYIPAGFSPDHLIPLVDRALYPEADYPAGQWDYMRFYQESFEAARAGFEANIPRTVKLLFRAGNPAGVGQPAPTAMVRKNGGWFGGGGAPDLPMDTSVLTEEDFHKYAAALERTGFFGPDSWYMNADRNVAYAAEGQGGWQDRHAGALPARRLRQCVHDRWHGAGRSHARRLRRPHRGHRAIRPLDGAGKASGGERGAGPVAGGEVSGAMDEVETPYLSPAGHRARTPYL